MRKINILYTVNYSYREVEYILYINTFIQLIN